MTNKTFTFIQKLVITAKVLVGAWLAFFVDYMYMCRKIFLLKIFKIFVNLSPWGKIDRLPCSPFFVFKVPKMAGTTRQY